MKIETTSFGRRWISSGRWGSCGILTLYLYAVPPSESTAEKPKESVEVVEPRMEEVTERRSGRVSLEEEGSWMREKGRGMGSWGGGEDLEVSVWILFVRFR